MGRPNDHDDRCRDHDDRCRDHDDRCRDHDDRCRDHDDRCRDTTTAPSVFGGMGAEIVAQLLGQPCIADGDLSDCRPTSSTWSPD
jgi:hypothetical protein